MEYIASWDAMRELVSVTIAQDVITFAQYKERTGPWNGEHSEGNQVHGRGLGMKVSSVDPSWCIHI